MVSCPCSALPEWNSCFSTYVGGLGDDLLRGLGVDSAGDAVVAGQSSGPNGFAPAWPLPGSKTQWNFIMKIGMDGVAPLIRHDWLRESATLGRVGNHFEPGLIAIVFGRNITAREGIVSAPSIPLPTLLDGVSVEVGGRPVPLYAVANVNGVEQINFLVPWD